MKYLWFALLLCSSCFAASNERLIAGEREFACSHEANGAKKIIEEVRDGLPEDKWYEAYPIPTDFPKESVEIIQKAVADAYKFEGSAVEFMRKIYSECTHR